MRSQHCVHCCARFEDPLHRPPAMHCSEACMLAHPYAHIGWLPAADVPPEVWERSGLRVNLPRSN